MKRFILFLLICCLSFSMFACGKDNGFSTLEEQIIAAIDACDAKTAYKLCGDALALDLTEEETTLVANYKTTIRSLCYAGTLIVQPENIIAASPSTVGEHSYFSVSMLQKYDEVFCRYTFEKQSEKELAAQQYKEYFDAYFTYLDLKVDDDYVVYNYSDETGNSIKLQVFNPSYTRNDFVVTLDSDLFDMTAIDTNKRSADLFDTSIVLTE